MTKKCKKKPLKTRIGAYGIKRQKSAMVPQIKNSILRK
jgi:hypothetical protein